MSKQNPKYAYRYCLTCNMKRICWKMPKNKWKCWACKKTKTLALKDARSIINERKRRQEEERTKASQQSHPPKPKKVLAVSNFLNEEMPIYKAWLERKNKKSMLYIPSTPPLILPRRCRK